MASRKNSIAPLRIIHEDALDVDDSPRMLSTSDYKKDESIFSKVKQFMRSIISIKFSLVITFVILMLLPTMIILIVTMLDLQSYVNEEVISKSGLASEGVSSKIWEMFTPPTKATKIMAFSFQQQVLDVTNQATNSKILFSIASSNPTFQHIYYNTIHNNAQVGYGRDANNSITFNYANSGTLYMYDSTQTNQLTGAVNQASSSSLLNVVAQSTYITATASATTGWTSPFYSASNNIYGRTGNSTTSFVYMSCYTSFIDLTSASTVPIGYVGVTVSLGLLNSYIQQLYVSDNSAIYIIENKQSAMIAGSLTDDVLYNTSSSQLNRYRLSQSSKPQIAYIGAQWENTYGVNLTGVVQHHQIITYGVSTYIVYPNSFTDGYGVDWTILVIISSDDFQEPTIRFRNVVVVTDVVIVIVSVVLGLVFALAITVPLDKLAKSMSQLRNLNITEANSGDTDIIGFLSNGKVFSEVKALSKDFDKMKSAVEG
jgi:hypothetical protein